MNHQIFIQTRGNPNVRCIISAIVWSKEKHAITCPMDKSERSSLVEFLKRDTLKIINSFSTIPGIEEIRINGQQLTIIKEDIMSWTEVEREILKGIAKHFHKEPRDFLVIHHKGKRQSASISV